VNEHLQVCAERPDPLRHPRQLGHGALTRGDHAPQSQPFDQLHRLVGAVHRHLGRAVDGELREPAPERRREAEVLHDHGVDTGLECFLRQRQREGQLVRVKEGVQRDVDADAVLPRGRTQAPNVTPRKRSARPRALKRAMPR
jgi:hypothetical protein